MNGLKIHHVMHYTHTYSVHIHTYKTVEELMTMIGGQWMKVHRALALLLLASFAARAAKSSASPASNTVFSSSSVSACLRCSRAC